MSRRLALIIGNSAYRDGTLARLLTPDIDVGALAETLLDPEVGAFDDANVLVNMTSATVRRAISDFFVQKSREDLLLLYFSGHGVLDDRGRLHLAVKDTDHNLLRGTAVAASFIADEMDNSRSQRQVLILDCCHSGAFARGTKGSPGLTVGTAAAFEGTGFGRVVLTATDATQYAWEGDRVIGEAESSLFTHYIVQGLQSGEADINGDGQITIDELYDYVYAQVVQQTPKQTPGKWSFKEQGEIVIARAGRQEGPRPIVAAQPFIDVELQQKLQQLYTKGLSAYWLEEWEQAAHNFQLILEINPDYQDATEKFAEVRRQLKLKNLYDQALAAFEAQKYREAVTAYEALLAEAPDYEDAASKLQAARKQGKVADLYTQAKQLHQAQQWQAVIHIFERIAELTPDFVDPQELLPTARHEFEGQKRLAEIQGRYQQALRAMNSGKWLEARNSFSQIQEQEPGFEDTERLLARAEAEIKKQEAQRQVQERVGTLYEQAISLSRARQWRQALEKMKEIEILNSEFADREGIAASAEAELVREEQEAQRQNELAALYAEAVRLLRVGQYQEALEKWDEVKAIKPDYYDHHKVQKTARQKLAALTEIALAKRRVSRRAIAIVGGIGLIAVLVAGTLWAPGLMAPPSTPTRTPRPTPLPTATIDADPTVYDNFENPANDGSYNKSQWSTDSPPAKVSQQNGVVALSADTPDEITDLYARKYPSPLQSSVFFEAELKLDPNRNGGSVLMGPCCGYLDTNCMLEPLESARQAASCWIAKQGSGLATFPQEGLMVTPGSWHTFRIDFDRATRTFTFFIDGRKVGSKAVSDADLQGSRPTFALRVGKDSASPTAVTGYFDNVRSGPLEK